MCTIYFPPYIYSAEIQYFLASKKKRLLENLRTVNTKPSGSVNKLC